MTGNVNVPKITAPTTQVYQPLTQAQPYQRDSYNYTPRQFSASPTNGPVMVAKPQGYANGPTLMDRPVQGYQAPMRAVDYSYRPQYTPARQIPSPQWAIPQYPAPVIEPPTWENSQTQIIRDQDGTQIGGPRFNSDGMYIGTWESGLSDGVTP